MRMSLRWLVAGLVIVAAAAWPVFAQEPVPRITSVEPQNGKAGAEITVTGEHIGKALIAKLYFTDGKNDLETAILDQADTTLKCKIPAGVKPGVRYRLMLLTKGKEPKLIEQPVRVEIDEQ
jgi:hypothetical protein